MLFRSTDFSLWCKRWCAGRCRIIVTGECGYSSICWQCCHTIYSSVICMIHFWSHCLAASCLFYFFRFLFVFFIFLCRILDGLFCCVFRLIGLVLVFAAFRCFWDDLIAWRRYWCVVGLFAWRCLIDLFLGWFIGVASFGWFVFGTAYWRGVVWLICFCDFSCRYINGYSLWYWVCVWVKRVVLNRREYRRQSWVAYWLWNC